MKNTFFLKHHNKTIKIVTELKEIDPIIGPTIQRWFAWVEENTTIRGIADTEMEALEKCKRSIRNIPAELLHQYVK